MHVDAVHSSKAQQISSHLVELSATPHKKILSLNSANTKVARPTRDIPSRSAFRALHLTNNSPQSSQQKRGHVPHHPTTPIHLFTDVQLVGKTGGFPSTGPGTEDYSQGSGITLSKPLARSHDVTVHVVYQLMMEKAREGRSDERFCTAARGDVQR
jgi:hypothetical protein